MTTVTTWEIEPNDCSRELDAAQARHRTTFEGEARMAMPSIAYPTVRTDPVAQPISFANRRADALQPISKLVMNLVARTQPEVLLRYMVGVSTARIVADIVRVSFPDAWTGLDITPGRGGFWSSKVPLPGGFEVQLSQHDFRSLPFADRAFDVVFYDPPHLADAGRDSIMGRRFGSFKSADWESTVLEGVVEAERVSAKGVVVKVCNHVHGQRFVDMRSWITSMLGTPYDEVHQVRAHSLRDPRWRGQYSAYSNGAIYLVFRWGDPTHRARLRFGVRPGSDRVLPEAS